MPEVERLVSVSVRDDAALSPPTKVMVGASLVPLMVIMITLSAVVAGEFESVTRLV